MIDLDLDTDGLPANDTPTKSSSMRESNRQSSKRLPDQTPIVPDIPLLGTYYGHDRTSQDDTEMAVDRVG